MTYAKQAGMYEGGFYLLKGVAEGSPGWVKGFEGYILELIQDDGTTLPKFRFPNGRTRFLNISVDRFYASPGRLSLVVPLNKPDEDESVSDRYSKEIV